MLRLPAILSDIDGVLYRGSKLIKGSDIALRTLLKYHSFGYGRGAHLPFSLLTNGGGVPEAERADVVN
jgi:ribonucleotide monophosphatase NagD (HAD superfamily)